MHRPIPDLLAFSDSLMDREPLEVTVQRVIELAVGAIPGGTSAAASLMKRDRLVTIAATDDDARVVDSAQFKAQAGPCLDAVATGEPVRADRLTEAGSWPAFAEIAVRKGIRSVVAYPLVAGPETVGALDIFSDRDDAFDDDSVALGELFASQAAIVIHNSTVFNDAARLVDQLTEAVRNRPPIEQAKGILMQRLGLSADDAFEHLRTESQRTNRKLRDIAIEIVGSVSSGEKPEEQQQ